MSVRELTVTVMDLSPVVSMDVPCPELPEQHRPFEVIWPYPGKTAVSP
jgi:hypothetical protein